MNPGHTRNLQNVITTNNKTSTAASLKCTFSHIMHESLTLPGMLLWKRHHRTKGW